MDIDDRGKLRSWHRSRMIRRMTLPRRLGIEARGRLIDQQQFGLLVERPRDADALALTAGQRIGAFVDMVDQADALQHGKRLVDIGL